MEIHVTCPGQASPKSPAKESSSYATIESEQRMRRFFKGWGCPRRRTSNTHRAVEIKSLESQAVPLVHVLLHPLQRLRFVLRSTENQLWFARNTHSQTVLLAYYRSMSNERKLNT